MRQMDTCEVIEQMESEDIVRDIILIHPEFPAIGFEDDECRWYIAGLLEIIPQNVPIYQKIFNKYLLDLKKDFNTSVIPANTVPLEFIQYLNIMNGFLLGGRAIRDGVMTLEQAIDAGVQQQGGCLDPP